MASLQEKSYSSKFNLLIDVSKIIVISISAIYLLGNFIPFYEGQDAYLYGIESILLSQGTYEISNPLFEETKRLEFTGGNWNPTIRDTIIPVAGIGTPILGAIAFTIGGYYGLFYLGPILGILLLIIYERISTKLFGKYVGFLALLFFASCHIFFRSALLLNTDAMLTLFFIPGIYYLIKFLRDGNKNNILLTSIFFGIASLIKIPALAYFPLEISVIVVYFVIQLKRKRIVITKSNNQNLYVKALFTINRTKLLKISIFAILPWIVFFTFWFSYNDYFYGDPTSTYISVRPGGESTSSSVQTLLTLEQRDFEQFKDYSKYTLPYQIPATYNRLDNNFDESLGKNWPGLMPIPLILLSLFLAFKEKAHRIEFLVFTFFIFGIFLFYSGEASEERAELGLPARYMLPAISLTFLIWSYMIVRIFEKLQTNRTRKYLRVFLIVILGIFFVLAFSFSPPFQFLSHGSNFKNPVESIERYPLDKEGLSEKSILLIENTDLAIEYGITPFQLNDPLTWEPEKINFIEELIQKEYSVYTFKKLTSKSELEKLKYLINNNNIVLIDFSNTFCKMHLNNATLSTDSVCISDIFQSDTSKKYDLPFLN